MKLWGGRFTKEENQLVHNFNASISFDQKFYKQDIEGSIAHVTMLAKQGAVSYTHLASGMISPELRWEKAPPWQCMNPSPGFMKI